MQKFCPACGTVYDDEALTVCPDDSERLMVLQGEPDLIGQTLEDKYAIKSKLGQGGMGTVYLAHQSSMRRDVAIKVLRPQFAVNMVAVQRFLREARAASQLSHPNTITVYDSGRTDDGHLFLVMELLTGTPLSDVLGAANQVAPDRAAHILAQICDSLSEAHDKGIIHRDLKAENVFLVSTAGNPEHVKVLDFGIAKMTEDTNTQATATGMICGTPAYMSPEQAMGRELTPASDVYAIGVLLWEMLAGTRPFGGNSPMEVMLKHINDPVPELPEGVGGAYRRELQALLGWVLEKKAKKRAQSCREVKQRLRGIFTGIASANMMGSAEEFLPVADRIKTQDEPATLKTGLSPSAKAPSLFGQGVGVAVGAAVGVAVVFVWLSAGSSGEPIPIPADQSTSAASLADEPRPVKKKAKTKKPIKAATKPVVPPSGELAEALPLTLTSLPSGASVTDAQGVALGPTPFTTTHPAGTWTLHLSLSGYADRTVVVDSSAKTDWSVELVAEQEQEQEPGVAAEPSGKPPVKSKSNRPVRSKGGKKAYPTF
jgi:serine/threonine protein kinase